MDSERWLLGERERDRVDVAPGPILARLGGPDERMSHLVEVRGRVPVRRRVAAADLPARQAHAEVHPAVARLQALLAAEQRIGQLDDLHALDMRATHRAIVSRARASLTARDSDSMS